MRKSSVILLVVLLGALCLSGASFVAGIGFGWYGKSLLSSSAVAIDARPPTLPSGSQAAEAAQTRTPAQAEDTTTRLYEQAVADSRLQVFSEAWELIGRDFYSEQPLDYREAAYGAIRGLIGTLEDPHTSFVEPPQHELDKSGYEGKFGGIGAYIGMTEQGQPFVSAVMPGQPAEAAGLRSGDVIVKVDGQSLDGRSQDEVVLLIRGPVETTVTLTIRREGTASLLDIAIIRAEIKQTTVSWEALDDGRVGYVQLTFFAEPTGSELAEALREIGDLGISRIILDLRGNRGGLLSSSGEVASQFLAGGVLLHERQRGAAGETIEQAYMIPDFAQAHTDERLVVLVDRGTASAAEIVAGAIQDYERGILIGETTYGKGSMQYVHELSDGSSLHVTAAHWLTPHKRPINGQGLAPDIEVGRSAEDIQARRDPQLERALLYLSESSEIGR